MYSYIAQEYPVRICSQFLSCLDLLFPDLSSLCVAGRDFALCHIAASEKNGRRLVSASTVEENGGSCTNCISTNCIGTICIGTNCIGTNCIGNKLYREQTVSGTYCIGNKLYREQIVSGTNCIGYNLHRAQIV
jgi:hypothetical protein